MYILCDVHVLIYFFNMTYNNLNYQHNNNNNKY